MIKNNIKKEKYNNLTINDGKFRQRRFNTKFNNENNNNNNINLNNNYSNKNEDINNYKNFYKYHKNMANTLKDNNINIINDKNGGNITGKNEQYSANKKQYNGLISKYFHFTYYKTEKKHPDNKSCVNDNYAINNIKPKKLEYSNQKNLDKPKNDPLSIGKYESIRTRESYRRFKYNIENKNKIDENNENLIKEEKHYILNNNEKYVSNIKRRHKGENKTKYNDLIKYKLSVCDSINKRKK